MTRSYVVAVAVVVLATVIGVLGAPALGIADVAMIYLLAILVAALGGRGPGLTAAALAVASLDFFFVPPRYTFAVADAHALITFAMMFVIGAAFGSLVARVRRAESAARSRELQAQSHELRTTLLSSVSHDLRTPLAVITGTATGLRDTAPAEQREQLDTIVDEAERLSRIVTNVLSITKVEAGAAPRRDWVPLEEVVGSALGRFELELADRPVTVKVADELAHIDPILTEQLLSNLLENVLRHTPAGTPLDLEAHREGAATILTVADRGPGLPDAPVFDKFVRGRAGGFGLGLAVCRAIATAHGGTIAASSPPGGGASFRVTFPDAGPPPGPEPEEAT